MTDTDQAKSEHKAGCLACGASLDYEAGAGPAICHLCGREEQADVRCTAGHFVCDTCHTKDGLALIVHACLTTAETDMIALKANIRSHQAMPLHGPDHHALVPGVILGAYRNLGGDVSDEMILKGIRRGGPGDARPLGRGQQRPLRSRRARRVQRRRL